MPGFGPKATTFQDAYGRALKPGGRMVLFEDWKQLPGLPADLASGTEATRTPVNRNWMVDGASANETSALATAYAGGGLQLETAGASADEEGVIPHDITKQSIWRGTTWPWEDGISFETELRTTGSVADMVIMAGFKVSCTTVTATDADQACFRYAPATNGGRWQTIESASGTDTATDSGSIAPLINTVIRLRIDVSTSRFASFYINNAKVYGGAVQLTSGLTSILPVFDVATSTGSAKSAVCRWIRCTKNYT